LNKDLSKIIYKYIDYSLEHLLSIKSKIQYDIIYKINYSMNDIIVKTLRLGYNGFYTDDYDINQQLCILEKPEYIILEFDQGDYYYTINFTDKFYINITDLDVIERSIEKELPKEN
jgi:hypothetical protein